MKTRPMLVSKPRAACAAFVLLAALAGCGGNTQEVQVKSGGDDTSQTSTGNTPGFEAEVGALDEAKVQATFQKTLSKLTGCHQEGIRRVPFLGGEVRFALRIGQDGAAHVAYLKESTLGDRDTEACMLRAVREASWPSPVGGKEGLAEGGFAFDPSPDERPPVELAPERLGKELPKVRSAIAQCRAGKGAGPIKATMYVGTDGSPMAVGVSSADDKGEAAASCVRDALRGMKFPSPGSYAGKVSVAAD